MTDKITSARKPLFNLPTPKRPAKKAEVIHTTPVKAPKPKISLPPVKPLKAKEPLPPVKTKPLITKEPKTKFVDKKDPNAIRYWSGGDTKDHFAIELVKEPKGYSLKEHRSNSINPNARNTSSSFLPKYSEEEAVKRFEEHVKLVTTAKGLNVKKSLVNLKASDSTRKLGKNVAETGGPAFVVMFRAVAKNITTFKDMDYVTLSRKLAIEHAEHNAVVNDEEQIVIKKGISSKLIYEAYNPGEYFYHGPEVQGKKMYTAPNENYGVESSLITEGDCLEKTLEKYQADAINETNPIDLEKLNVKVDEVKQKIAEQEANQMNVEAKLGVFAKKKIVKKKRSSKQILNNLKSGANKLLKMEERLKAKKDAIDKELAKLKGIKLKHKERIQKHLAKVKDREAKKAGAINPPTKFPKEDLAKALVKKKK